ncbi:MAG: hypothetical protein KC619_16365, partial [Myxococcales bacterium]|nr:hypothetical protein [Myxococcales bacterium]
MAVPADMAELEERCWALAGERMVAEPMATVLANAGPLATRLLSAFVDDPEVPVATFFAEDAADVRDVLAPEGWATVAEAFLRWAGHSLERDDRWVAAVDGIDQAPPLDPKAFPAWLMRHGVRRRLTDPLKNAEPLGADPRVRFDLHQMGSRTIEDALEGRLSVRDRDALRDAARSYLSWAAGRLRLRRAREEYWNRDLEPKVLRDAAARLKALLQMLDRRDARAVPVPLGDAVFAPSADGFSLELRVERQQAWRGSVTVSIHLLEMEAGGVALHRGGGAAGDDGLVRLCAEHAMDAICDDEHELHAGFRAILDRPRWAHLLADLEREVEPWAPTGPFEEDERLIWRIGERDGVVFVEAALQKRKKRSGWTRGRGVDQQQLASRALDMDPRDQAVLRALDDRFGRGGSDGEALLALVGHPRVVSADRSTVPVRVRRRGLDVRFEEVRSDLHLAFRVGDQTFTPSALRDIELDRGHVAFFEPSGDVVTVAEVPPPIWTLIDVWERWSTGLPPAADDALLALLDRLPDAVGRELPPRLRGEAIAADPRLVARLEPLPGGGLATTLLARPLPGGPVQPPGEGPIHLLGVLDAR